MGEDKGTALPGNVVRIDEERIKDHLGRIVRGPARPRYASGPGRYSIILSLLKTYLSEAAQVSGRLIYRPKFGTR
jgi:hypothetical protein